MSIVGENIRRLRLARSLKQSDLGEMVGVDQRTISGWENGLRDPGSKNIRLIADLLDVAPSEIIGHNSAPSDTTYQIPVQDDSMSPDIRKGDTITVSTIDEVHDGDVVMVQVSKMDRTVLCRRMFTGETGVTLLSYNPAINPITVDKSDVVVKGRVTKVERRL